MDVDHYRTPTRTPSLRQIFNTGRSIYRSAQKARQIYSQYMARSRGHGRTPTHHRTHHRHHSRSNTRSAPPNPAAHPGQNVADELIDRYHPVAQFEHKKTKFTHHKQHAPKTLKGKIKKEIKKAAIKMSPPCQIMEYKNTGLEIQRFLPNSTDTTAWQDTPFQCMTFATQSNGLRFLTGGVNLLGSTTTTELARCIEHQQFFPEIVGSVNGTLTNTIGTTIQNVNANSNIKAVQQDKYQNTFYLSSFEADIDIINTQGSDITYEIYELQAQRNITADDQFKDVASAVQACLVETLPNIGGTQQATTLQDWRGGFGNMLEDVPNLWKHWKIMNRTRIKLPAGDATAIQFKGPRKTIMDWYKVREFTTMKHLTTEFVIVVGNGPCIGLQKANINNGKFTVQTRIKYRMMGSNSAQLKVPIYTINTV